MANSVSFGVQAKGVAKASSDMDRLKDKFDKLQKTSGKGLLVGAGAGLGLAAVNALSAGVGLATDAFFDAVRAGSDLNETMSKSAAVFGNNADAVDEWGDTTARSMGITKNAAIGAASGFGDLFNKLGLGPTKAKDMSQALVTLAADLASFNNQDPEEVLQKLKSGLAGESEPLRSLGVFLNEAKVKAKAMELGLASAHGELSEGAKVAARYALIMDETKSAQGDFARTSDQMANQQRILNAELEDTSAKLGQKLVPGFIGAQRAALGFFDTLELVTDGVATSTEGQKAQVDGLGDFLRAVNAIVPGAGAMADALEDGYDASQKLAAGEQAASDSTDRIVGDLSRGAASVSGSFGKMEDAAVDFRDKYRDATGEIIRSSHRTRAALVKDAATIRGEVFDETEIRADLHDQRLALFALKERKRDAKTAEEKRQASDDIIQALDDEGQALEDLGDQGKLTKKDVARFTKDTKDAMKGMSKESREKLQLLIDKYKSLAALPDISKTFTTTFKAVYKNGKAQDYSSVSGGPRAAGGPVIKGQVYTVGEKGPETFVPSTSGTIIPNGGTGTPSMAGGGATFNITVNAGVGSGLTAADGRRLAADIGPAIYADMQRRGMLPRAGTGLRG